MAGGIDRGHEIFVGESVRLVLVALPALVLHDIALEIDLGLVHCLEHPAEPVGFEPEHQWKRGDRARFVVVGAVGVGGTVVVGARGLEEAIELRIRRVLRAHKHQVLEEVREAGAADLFVAGTDVVPNVGGDDGDAVVLVHNNRQAVGEGINGDGDPDALGLEPSGTEQGREERAKSWHITARVRVEANDLPLGSYTPSGTSLAFLGHEEPTTGRSSPWGRGGACPPQGDQRGRRVRWRVRRRSVRPWRASRSRCTRLHQSPGGSRRGRRWS